jgi:uncharacterized membrane protein YuzA (DUF378 family)
MKSLKMLSYWLLVIGGLNWGLVGFFNYNLVTGIFGTWPMLERIIYMLVGLSAVYMLFAKGKK